MSNPQQIQAFDALTKRWLTLKIDKLQRTYLGKASYDEVVKHYDDFAVKLKEVGEIRNQLSDNLLSTFNNIGSSFVGLLESVMGYDDTTFVAQRANVDSQLRNYTEQILNIWPQIAALWRYVSDKANTDPSIANEILALSEKSKVEYENIRVIKNDLSKSMKEFNERYAEQVKSAELLKQSDIFQKLAGAYNDNSKYWLLATIISVIIFVVSLSIFFNHSCFEISCLSDMDSKKFDAIVKDGSLIVFYLEVFKAVAFRIFVLSMCVYLIAFCVKNYNAHMHNFTINSHKANSLAAALILLEKAKTSEGNDAIMEQAATTIFSHQPTGFNSSQTNALNPSILEKLIEKINTKP